MSYSRLTARLRPTPQMRAIARLRGRCPQARNAERLQRLTVISRLLSSTLSLDDLMPKVVQLASELVNAEAGSLALVDASESEMTYPYQFNLPATLADTRISSSEGSLAWQVVKNRIGILHQDYPNYPYAHRTWVEAGVREILAVPMLVGEERIGALALVMRSPHRHFQPEDLELLEGVARQAAIAIQNARLFAVTQRRLSRLDSLHAIDVTIASSLHVEITYAEILRQTCSQLGMDAGLILLQDDACRLKLTAARGVSSEFYQRKDELEVFLNQLVCPNRDFVNHHQVWVEPAVLESPIFRDEGVVSHFAAPLLTHGQFRGLLAVFSRQSFFPDREWEDFLISLAGQTAIALENSTLFQGLQAANMEMLEAYDTTLAGWARALELRDQETEGHSERVTSLCLELAEAMGLPREQMPHIRRGALLHDIGKMGVPDSILHKPGPLSPSEWEIMRLHPIYAWEMLRPITYLRPALDIPYCHHEKWDGSGYPRGLTEQEIPLAARLFAVVDVWDALRSNRSYRPAMPESKVLEYMRGQSAQHFDPHVLEVFLHLRERAYAFS